MKIPFILDIESKNYAIVGNPIPFHPSIKSKEELLILVKDWYREIQNISKDINQNRPLAFDLDPDKGQNYFRQIAETGYLLFQKVFAGEDPRNAKIRNLLWKGPLSGNGNYQTIQMTSDNFFLPWDVFYNGTCNDIFLFNWETVTESEDDVNRIRKFLSDDIRLEWATNANICKSDDKTIRITKDENSAEIQINDKGNKAILKTNANKICDLKVKKENNKKNIYSELDPDAIWGLKYIVETLMITEFGETVPETIIKNNGKTTAAIIYDASLDRAKEIENPTFRKYIRELGHAVNDVDFIHCNTKEGVKDFLDKTECQILYFHCHAKNNFENPEKSWICHESIDVNTIKYKWKIKKLRGTQLVFINACETGQINPLIGKGIMDMLQMLGAGVVIGSQCGIPKSIAPEFARIFFKEFLAGKTVGEALMKAKRDFLYEYNNPFGLTYALYGASNIKLEKPASEGELIVKGLMMDNTNQWTQG
jgi:hypothetical protein